MMIKDDDGCDRMNGAFYPLDRQVLHKTTDLSWQTNQTFLCRWTQVDASRTNQSSVDGRGRPSENERAVRDQGAFLDARQ